MLIYAETEVQVPQTGEIHRKHCVIRVDQLEKELAKFKRMSFERFRVRYAPADPRDRFPLCPFMRIIGRKEGTTWHTTFDFELKAIGDCWCGAKLMEDHAKCGEGPENCLGKVDCRRCDFTWRLPEEELSDDELHTKIRADLATHKRTFFK